MAGSLTENDHHLTPVTSVEADDIVAEAEAVTVDIAVAAVIEAEAATVVADAVAGVVTDTAGRKPISEIPDSRQTFVAASWFHKPVYHVPTFLVFPFLLLNLIGWRYSTGNTYS